MKELIRKTFNDSLCEFLIANGKVLADSTNPLALYKDALEFIEARNENRFINDVLNGVNNIDIQSLDAVKSLKRLYKTTQVITKAITNDKISRFKKLVINGIIYQEEISDEDYDVFLNIIDELTDTEFIILYKIHQIESKHENETFNHPVSEELGKKLLEDLNMENELFVSYIFRLKAKGLIIDAHGHWLSNDTPFFLSIVDGKISVLYKNLLNFINK